MVKSLAFSSRIHIVWKYNNMKPFLAIVMQTMRSAIRSKVFHVLSVLILLAVFLLPLTVSGDGTAVSLVQISIT